MTDTCKLCGDELLLEAERDQEMCIDCICVEHEHREAADLAAYRELLPLPREEWGGPITAEVCERLGMKRTQDRIGVVFWFVDDSDYVALDSGNRNGVYLDKITRQGWCKTAGQLMFLVAARRLNGDGE